MLFSFFNKNSHPKSFMASRVKCQLTQVVSAKKTEINAVSWFSGQQLTSVVSAEDMLARGKQSQFETVVEVDRGCPKAARLSWLTGLIEGLSRK